MPDVAFHPRQVAQLLRDALADSPVVLVHGPRQCGKTTLAQWVGGPLGYDYLSFDDDTVRAAAEIDPVGFVDALPQLVILDEVQRVPALFTTLKHAVDRRRSPGRFLLTGSANVLLLLPQLADSLAGRMALLRLHPLAQCELAGQRSGFLDALFQARFRSERRERLGPRLAEAIVAGGYPTALARPAGRRRRAWYRDYIEALVQRDVRDLSRIHALDALPRLLAIAAAQTAQLFNVSDLAAPFQLSRPTIADYVTLLERVFLLERLPPWYSNRISRLVKTPKLHLGDTGLACALLGVDAAGLADDRTLLGHVLETFVFQELRRQDSWADNPADFFHYRDRDGVEVDIVIARGARALAGVEVKAAATATARDFRGLEKLRAATGERFAAGVLLYDGQATLSFGDRLFAVPISALWQAQRQTADKEQQDVGPHWARL
ncbi:MAG: ATP-binding protein [Ottowia sp.]|nr:ATP-binding protein [Ottowia sp.]